jgi:H+/Cl- antiporter ClcA
LDISSISSFRYVAEAVASVIRLLCLANSFLKIIAALCAALLVQEYAFYAKHSGIPEIKTVLGGFVIRRFLGGWTLLTKSFGLVCTYTVLDEKDRY